MSNEDDMSILSILERGIIGVTARFFFRRRAERQFENKKRRKMSVWIGVLYYSIRDCSH